MSSPNRTCDHCGLVFSGAGWEGEGPPEPARREPRPPRHFCCYGCYLVQRIVGTQGEEAIAAWILIRLGLGAFLSMNVMMLSMVLYAQSERELGAAAVEGLRWAMLGLSVPAMAILAGQFAAGAARDLVRGRVSTDALIVTGSTAAFGVSAFHVVRGSGHIYFDTATMLLLIVTLGRLLEASAKTKTSRAIRDLMDLAPATARVIRDGVEVEIAAEDVRKGDMLVVRPGERVPADGRIRAGSCMVEEAAFTGESRPRSCAVGDSVYGGSVDCDGLIEVEATAVGADSLLAQVQEMVRRAQRERAPVERMVERVSSVFTPVVWAAAVGAAVYWAVLRNDAQQAGFSALAVLVVACPCALGLATSMATCLAMGKAARSGVLLRSGAVLESLPAVRQLFFDKTGTLTANRFSVADVRTADGVSADEVLARIAPLEAGSRHAIARAIVAEAEARGVAAGRAVELKVVPGLGIEGRVSLGRSWRVTTVGSLELLADGHRLPEELSDADDGDPLTRVYAGWDGEVRAVITFTDALRPEATETVRALQAEGVRVVVLSGDREAPTRRLAGELGIADALAGCSPAGKSDAVRKARECGTGRVAMVGDGINDAPALAEADVGIAVGSGTELARESSDVTLLGDDLTRIAWLLKLSRMTYAVIRQNLWWAFGYNTAAIVLAFLGFVHPLIAAIAMLVSSLTVIGNSMRIIR